MIPAATALSASVLQSQRFEGSSLPVLATRPQLLQCQEQHAAAFNHINSPASHFSSFKRAGLSGLLGKMR
ncbi:hypothetical protein KCP77_21315 [Salmonella enterica subsp. enterica]|nr:hypothetical protein KCP77_21315 [Salmonella enterica subsp. enterica]